jgi:sialate O-acetylesterase
MGLMKMSATRRLWTLNAVLMVGAIHPADADVRLAAVFSDDMILQRGIEARVWGWADAGENVTVTFGGQNLSATAGRDGLWGVKLKPMQASAEGRDLVAKGANTITLRNVLVGDVWLCSGQSNMDWGLGGCNAPEDIQSADLPLIRWFRVPMTCAETPLTDLKVAQPVRWNVCTPGNAAGISAVGFYFARKVHQETGVPVGVLVSSVGGTNIEKWMPRQAFAEDPELAEMSRQIDGAIGEYQAEIKQKLPLIEQWLLQTKAAVAAEQALPPQPDLPLHPSMPGSRTGGPWLHLYNGMIHPLANFRIKGALWYQGESNGGEGDSYFVKKRAMIGSWRKLWAQGDFPFYFVQLANFQKPGEDPAGGDGWAKVRMAQTKTLTLPNTGMAVAIDLADAHNPDDIHPTNKQDVGERLALWALAKDYGKKDLVCSGPLFKEMKIEGDKIRIAFDSVGSGLTAATKTGRNPAVADPQGKLQRFAIAGEDKQWVWADAMIDGASVVVSSASVPKPLAVRYAFTMNPAGANLYNKDGLPASPFRTDDW